MPRIYSRSFTVGAESIDAVGHVNNREYLRWMEEIAVEHSTAQGWPMQRYFDAGTAWVAARHTIEYLRPSMQGDALTASTWIERLDGRDSVRRYAILRERKLIARGETIWTFVDLASGHGREIPPDVLHAFDIVPGGDPELRPFSLGRRDRTA